VGERRRYDRKRGRVESALEAALVERHDVGLAERAALRVQAHALDLAEAACDPDLITTANHGYLELRVAAGLTSAGAKPVDAFDQLLAELAQPGAGAGDPTDR
jgi:hypothetical protein